MFSPASSALDWLGKHDLFIKSINEFFGKMRFSHYVITRLSSFMNEYKIQMNNHHTQLEPGLGTCAHA